MNDRYGTEQERFWAGGFGDDYISRNAGDHLVAANLRMWSNVLDLSGKVCSVLELGANIGLNLMALRRLAPDATLSAVEINERAVGELTKNVPGVQVTQGSLLDFPRGDAADLVFTKGVLIHLDPGSLARAYEVMHRASRRFIVVAEYYNPTPVEIAYRGHTGKLFKRDFAGELLDAYPDLQLRGYGFAYRRDPCWPQDDITWFLLEKR